MDYGDYYWGLYRDYCRDPFPHSLLSTRQLSTSQMKGRAFALQNYAGPRGTGWISSPRGAARKGEECGPARTLETSSDLKATCVRKPRNRRARWPPVQVADPLSCFGNISARRTLEGFYTGFILAFHQHLGFAGRIWRVCV